MSNILELSPLLNRLASSEETRLASSIASEVLDKFSSAWSVAGNATQRGKILLLAVDEVNRLLGKVPAIIELEMRVHALEEWKEEVHVEIR